MKAGHVLKMLFLLTYLLLMLHIGAEIFHWYWIFSWFDILTHFLGGICVGLGTLWFFFMSGYIKKLPWSGRSGLLYTFVGVGVIGVGWEFYEVFMHILFHNPFDRGYLLDTATDLAMDTLGAVLAYLCFAWGVKRRGIGEATKCA